MPDPGLVMTSSKPYLVRALYEWILDNDNTPYILVDAKSELVSIPAGIANDGKVVLNLASQNEFHLFPEVTWKRQKAVLKAAKQVSRAADIEEAKNTRQEKQILRGAVAEQSDDEEVPGDPKQQSPGPRGCSDG